jgi:hypothetical protein
VIRGYASPAQKAKIDEFMQANGGLDEAGLQRTMDQVEDNLNRIVPKQREYLRGFRQQESQVEPIVRDTFADVKIDQKGHADYIAAQGALRVTPELRSRTPGHKIALIAYALGMREVTRRMAARQAKAAPGVRTNGAPAARPAPPKAAAPRTAAPSRVPAPNAREAQVRQQFNKRYDSASAVELAKMALRTS